MTLQDLTGQTLGQYELRELIGAGGMGAVYRAHQKALEREVAVKVLSKALAAESGYVERFYREAKTAAALEHAHIVPVHDFGIQRDHSYVAMRLLTGGTLADRMQRRVDTGRPLPSAGETASLLRQVASALDYAHSQGVIHRDIKPSNIMFDNQGNAYLVDFGIAKLLGATSALTSTGSVMGTPAFMPPEQWRSEDLTPAADQYALGATIYALLIGRVPYEATTPFGLMHKHLNEMPTPAHDQRPDLSADMSLALERALAKRPEDRFPTITAFAQAYEAAIAGNVGQRTGFFTMSLPGKKPAPIPTLATAVESQSGTPPTLPPPPPPAAAAAAPHRTPPAEPSMVLTPPAAARPAHRSPIVWVLAFGLIAALAVIGVLVFGGGKEDQKTGTPIPGAIADLATDTATAIPPTPAVTATGASLIAILPTATPTPTATETPIPTATHTPQPSPTNTPPPTDTPTLPPTATQSPQPSATRTPRPTNTRLPTSTVTPESAATRTPHPTATPVEVAAGPASGEPVLVVGVLGAFIRSAPALAAERIGSVDNIRLPLTGRTSDNRWYRVQWDDREGWIKDSVAVRIEGDLDTVPVFEPGPAAVAVVGTLGAHLRAGPSPDAELIATVDSVRLPITAQSPDGLWYRVEWDGREAWVSRAFVSFFEGDLGAVPVFEPESGPAAILRVGEAGVTVRVDPGFDAESLGVAVNTDLPLLTRTPDGQWFQVDWEGRPGWVRRSAGVSIEGDLDAVPVFEPEFGPAAILRVGEAGVTVRVDPSFDAETRGIATNADLPLIGRTPDGQWFQVDWEGRPGWVRRSAGVSIEGDLDAVPVFEPESRPAAILRVGEAGVTVRVDPGFDSESLGVAVNTDLPLLARTPDGQWFQVDWEGRPGWVRRSAGVSIEGDLDAVPVFEPEFGPAAILRVGEAGVTVRVDPGFDAESLGVAVNTDLPLLARTPDGQWFQVDWEGRPGWVRRSAGVSIEGDLDAVPVFEPESGPAAVLVINMSGVLVRVAPDADAERLATITNTRLPVTGRTPDGVWYRVEWEGREAWIRHSIAVRVEGNLDAVPVVDLSAGAAQPRKGTGVITYRLLDGHIFRVRAEPDSPPQDLSLVLESPTGGTHDEWVNISADGSWLLISTDRFDPACVGWPCLALISSDLKRVEVPRAYGEPVHSQGFAAISSESRLIVYESDDGPHASDMWAIQRQGDAWSEPELLSWESPFAWNSQPALSVDGSRVVFDCGDEPYGGPGTAICEAPTDGSTFRVVITPGDTPTGAEPGTALHHPAYLPNGSIVFEADWKQTERIWWLPLEGPPELIGADFTNDDSPCVLPDGRIASLWLNRPENPEGLHELKVMAPGGKGAQMIITGVDVLDAGIGCGAG